MSLASRFKERHRLNQIMHNNQRRHKRDSLDSRLARLARLFYALIAMEGDYVDRNDLIYDWNRVDQQQAEVRRIVSDSLTGTKKTRIRRWVDLASLAKGSRV